MTRPKGFLVTPGASADRDHRTLVALEQGIPELEVRRLTLATTSVPNAVRKIVEASNELASELDCQPTDIALGGRSFGGRACSVAVAEGQAAHSLVLLSYPLHPPGKPDKLRVEHFGDLRIPTLFVSGVKDPFGTETEFVEHIATIPGSTQMEWIPGNHSPTNDTDVVALTRSFLLGESSK